jgi:hypothetical protein
LGKAGPGSPLLFSSAIGCLRIGKFLPLVAMTVIVLCRLPAAAAYVGTTLVDERLERQHLRFVERWVQRAIDVRALGALRSSVFVPSSVEIRGDVAK